MSSRTTTTVVITCTVLLLGVGCLPLIAVVLAEQASAACLPRPTAPVGTLDTEQSTNAAIIVTTVRTEFPVDGRRSATIALTTALQESSLRNLDHGDAAGPDSRGLFQQRLQFYPDVNPLDPADATRGFIRRLHRVADWSTRRPTSAVIVEVQRFRDTPAGRALYDAKEPLAQQVADELWPPSAADADVAAPSTCPSGVRYTGPLVDGYALPLDPSWYQAHADWFSAPHHDYPAADIPVPTGTTVFAAAAGTVVAAPAGDKCGNGVIIDGEDGHRYTYCHGLRPLVPRGAQVKAGDPIMVSGSTGASTGPHLHFQIDLGPGTGALVCPQLALAAWATGQGVNVSTLPRTGCIG
jgi:murein DD-endopeptidase MepM/ murein hydrolase activator NlpD